MWTYPPDMEEDVGTVAAGAVDLAYDAISLSCFLVTSYLSD